MLSAGSIQKLTHLEQITFGADLGSGITYSVALPLDRKRRDILLLIIGNARRHDHLVLLVDIQSWSFPLSNC